MKKISYFAVLLTAILFTFSASGQEVLNGGFETASSNGHPNNATHWDQGCSQNYYQSTWIQGSSDLYRTASGNMPAQNRVNPRNAGNYNFAGMLGPKMSTINGQPTLVRGESLINQVVNGTFIANREYTISFYAARYKLPANSGQQPIIKMEAVLRVYGDCTQEKIIPININVPIQNFGEGANATNNWTFLSTTFTLNTTEEAQQFDAIEIRPKYEGVDFSILEHIFIDDLDLLYTEMSTADIEEVNPIAYTIVDDTYYGELNIPVFCEGDILVDGSGSENETNYYITVKEFDLINWTPVSGGVSYTTQPINGQVPSSIDLEAAIGASLNPGTFYQASIIVGPDWHADWLYFTVTECCPDELEVEVDCEKGQISVTNLPQGSTVTFTKWSWKKKITGAGNQFFAGSGNYSSVSPVMGNGFYSVTMTITLANGMECEVSGITYYSEEDCCQAMYPNGLEALVAASNNIIGYQTVAACGTTFDVPIICNTNREYSFDISLCPNIDGYSIYNGHFNTSNCTDYNTLYSTAGSGTIPSPLTLTPGQLQAGAVNNLSIYASDPGLNPTSQSVNILWIPGSSEQCGNAKRYTIELEDPKGEVTISEIHPNPANNFATVSLSQIASGTVGVFSMDGRELTSVSFEDQQEVTLSTMDLPNGMYIVQLNVNNQTITKKLIKE